MPAVTVEDTTTLSRVPLPAPGTVRRRTRSVTTAPSGFEGEGFPVRRAFAGVDLRDLDPFIHMDQMGEVEYAPGEPKGTSWHPHRGFETVTYIIDGTFEHADSHGGGGTISNGDTQWMTAGGGVLHIEKPPEALVMSGGLFHGLQLWVNLPHGAEVGRAAVPGPAGAGVGPAGQRRRRCAAAGHRRGRRRCHRSRVDVHADGDGARHRRPGRDAGPAVAAGLQRPGLRAVGRRLRRDRRRAGAHRAARGARPRGHRDHPRRGAPGVAHAGARRRRPRRRARSASRSRCTGRS